MEKKYINAQTLLDDSLELALKIAENGFKPDLIVGIWRGGTPVAIAIHEVLEFIGINSDHFAVRTMSYTSIGKRHKTQIDGLEYIQKNLNKIQSILLVDDVFDTGLSIKQLIDELESLFKQNVPEIRVATPYFKPESNQTTRRPDFFLHESSHWLVFPHELLGLSNREILEEKPGIDSVRQRLQNLREKYDKH